MIAERDELFVGRQREAARIRAELVAKRNLVLTGPFGIGRTALLRHVARNMEPSHRFVFLDCSQTGGEACRRLHFELFPTDGPSGGCRRLRLASLHHGLAMRPFPDPRQHVLVFDDVVRLPLPRLKLIRWLCDLGRFQLVAVAEQSLPEEERTLLRVALLAAPVMLLGPLSREVSARFFRAWSERHGLAWGSSEIHGLILATRGYPLGMCQAARGSRRQGARPAARQTRVTSSGEA